MAQILTERGYNVQGLKAECLGFKCTDISLNAKCCCRRILFNELDFRSQKSALEEFIESRGHKAIFYPKYHCELNFIEQCWGRAKFFYRMMKRPHNEEELSLLRYIITYIIYRFANRSARFMDCYRKGLNGKQAVWTSRRYHGHRIVPDKIMEELDKYGI
ncbi:uncharacterized protein FOMMEDRAFT_75712 [Fomitiporia mediterranea MF3/22]|uniref:uncharacterized protein n=1 Tax=Fomitiporia mediterranea (strain MF3/22) TaxID=694068 RepID=UPI0004408A4E|nr:uncharacterized protein FOMMEDRAFT_75712 [Fomitiporia mediterranea MF3/22]EJD06377.1 hypothetical protein FOMMEDRAFT_75712 [Fomitiporia mediterranea MF3/22]